MAVVHGKIVVDAVVHPQWHAVEYDTVAVDLQPLFIVELPIVVAYRLAVNRACLLVHRTVVRDVPQRARDVALSEVLHETAHVVRHLNLVRGGQVHFVDETVDDGKLRTVRPDVHHQQFWPPRRFHTRLPL